MTKQSAFTLAEVLITLTIIGVIATLTIVPLHSEIEEQITVAKVNSTFKLMEDAYRMAQAKYGPINKWGLSASTQDCSKKDENGGYCTGSTYHLGTITKRMFEDIIDEEKLTDYLIHYINSDVERSQKIKYRLKNGVWLTELWVSSPKCNGSYGLINDYCGDFKIDINGTEGPNEFGTDTFVFIVTKKHILPLGIKGLDTLRPVKTHCNIKSTVTFNGYGCTAWVIYKKNMKYLEKEVDWDTD